MQVTLRNSYSYLCILEWLGNYSIEELEKKDIGLQANQHY